MQKRSILSRLNTLEMENIKEPYFIVECEDGTKKSLNGHELIMYSLRQTHPKCKAEFPAMTKIYCRSNTEQYLQLPFAVITCENAALPEVVLE